MPNYTNILYWKWDHTIFENNNMENKLMDIIERSNFELLYIAYHHINYTISDPRILDLVRRCNDILCSSGRKLMLDMDIRIRGEEFNEVYPGEKGFLTRFIELELDQSGNSSVEFENLSLGRPERKTFNEPPEYIINGWAFNLLDEKRFLPETLVNIKECTYINKVDDFNTRITIKAGKENACKNVLIYPAIRHAIPDLFSPNLYEFYSSMFEIVKNIPVGGSATDEWG